MDTKIKAAWQPIETAPRHELLLLSAVGWQPSIVRGVDWPVKVGGHWDGRWHVFGASWQPTHWMHLPAPPTQSPMSIEARDA